MDQYQQILAEVKVAIFGMKRQEAAGNIFQLLNLGAKIFLREQNTLLTWLRNKGFIVFSIEKDLQSIKQITELSDQEIKHNQACYDRHFNPTVYSQMMMQLISE